MATMADVARVAGVAGSTVSHVLNGTRHVSEETRSRVLKAVDVTGYRYNSLARSLAVRKTRTIGLSISVLTNPYFGSLVNAIEKRARAEGYTLVLGDSHDDNENELRVVNSLLDRRVDGLIVAPSPGAREATLPVIAKAGTPVVLIDRFLDADCDQVEPDNVQPVRRITEHLLDKGHTRIGAVAGLAGLQTSAERLQGFEEAFASRGLRHDPALAVAGDSQAGTAHRAVLDLFRQPEPPTGLVVLNNAMTIGTMRALRELGLRVPDDVALVCYDDFEWADLFEPRLTAIAQDVVTMGATAVDMLLARMDGEAGPIRKLQIPTTFNHRNSCGCP
jgi:LacI family transcriptional regulator